jgi:UDP-N-acetylmuramoyl-tripeptide--D-alanyl-D-alanine ligase
MTGHDPLWSNAAAVAATGGRATRPWAAEGVSIDSRTLRPGDLFVALAGPNFDGHAFVGDAFTRGAAAAVVSNAAGLAEDAPLLVVADTFAALRDLGAAARARAGARIAGITGSLGKTSIKEALRLVLGRQGPTHASDGSLNNHWGLPLSLARLSPAASFAVFEIGMNHPGEIEPLTRLARPDVGVITTVEGVHKEHFPSVEAIADAKAEIFLGLDRDGIAVLNRDNPHFPRLARHAADRGISRLLGFGRTADADVRLLSAVSDEQGSDVCADVEGRIVEYRVGVAGGHWVVNSLCVLATVLALGADIDAAAVALADLRPAKGRGERACIAIRGGSFELIDDSYNASPPSMAAAFEVLGRARPGSGGRRIAMLGDMLELGDEAAGLHASLARPLIDNRVDLVLTAGPLMAHLHQTLPASMRGGHADDSAALAPLAAAAVRPGDVIVVKGSAGSRMRRIVDSLLALGDADDARAGAAAPATADALTGAGRRGG